MKRTLKKILATAAALLLGPGAAFAYTINGNLVVTGNITSPSITGTVSGSATYTSVTLTTPTIASFVNATHSHQNAAGGGTLDCAAITGSVTGSGNCVKGTSPTIASPTITGTVAGNATYSSVTLTTPTIASFTNAVHNHANAAGGGQLDWDNIWTDAVHDHSSSAEGGNIPEASITDGTILARVAASETISGSWVFQPNITFNNDVLPNSDASGDNLGSPSLRWDQVYAANVGSGGGIGDTNIVFSSDRITIDTNDGHNVILDASDASFAPGFNDSTSLGRSGFRWTEVFATNGVINTSDLRLKKNVKDSNLGLSFVESLRPVSYEWKEKGNGTHYGFIAQEVEKTLKGKSFSGLRKPQKKGEYYGLSYTEMIAPMVKAIQELSEKVDRLEKKNGTGL